jgi:hypothetical protein
VRNFFLSLLCFSSLGASAQTSYPGPGGIPDCIARYDFSTLTNGGASLTDISGNNHTGSVYNVTSISGWRGQLNSAMKFNGQSSYVQVAHTSLLSPQAVTMIGLVRPDSFYSGPCQANVIVEKGHGWEQPGTYALFYSDQRYDNNCNAFNPTQESIDANLGLAHFTPSATPAPIQAGQWYFMAATFDGNTVSVYQQLMDTSAASVVTPVYSVSTTGGSMGTNNMDVLIGRTLNQPFPYWFNGAMDEVVLFNRGLSTSEIYTIYKHLWGRSLSVNSNPLQANPSDVTVRIQSGQLQLTSADNQALGQVTVYNITGQKLVTGTYNDLTATLDASVFPHELLLVQIVRKGAVLTFRTTNF